MSLNLQLSRQITILEDNFGISLLERNARGAVLTSAGELLFDHILRLANNEQSLKVELQLLKGLDRGHVRISCGSGFADDLVQHVLPAFTKAHPGMTYSVMVAGSDNIIRSLLDENADVGLHLVTLQHPKLEVVASKNWPLHVIMPIGHPLCEQDQIDAGSLVEFPLALPPAAHRIRQLLSEIAISEGFQLNPLMECNSYSALKGFVASGLGLSVMSVYAAASEIVAGKITTRPLKNAAMSETTASIVVRKGRTLSLAATASLCETEACSQQLLRSGASRGSKIISRGVRKCGRVLASGALSISASSQQAASPPGHSAMTTSTIVPFGAAGIAVETAGIGQPLVFLHANVADRRMWRHQFSTLASRYQVIAFDRRGFGETPAVDEPYSQTDDLFAVIDHLVGKDKRVILVGCSQGGAITIDAALAAPARVAAMVVISSSVTGSPVPRPTDAVQHLIESITLAEKAGDIDLAIRRKAALWLDGALAQEGRVKGPARDLFVQMNRIVLTAPAIGRVLQPKSAWDRLNQVSMPVGIFCGDLDIPHIQERGKQLAGTFANARFEILTGSAHLPSLDQPEHLTARFSDWLSTL